MRRPPRTASGPWYSARSSRANCARSSSAATDCSSISSTHSCRRSRRELGVKSSRARGSRARHRRPGRLQRAHRRDQLRPGGGRRRRRRRLLARRRDPGRRFPLRQDADLHLHGDAVRSVRGQLPAHRGRLREPEVAGDGRARTARSSSASRSSRTRLQQIRNERRPGSRYASAAQCDFEVRSAEALFQRYGVPYLNTTECSIEEIASRIIDRMGIERRLRP